MVRIDHGRFNSTYTEISMWTNNGFVFVKKDDVTFVFAG